ncbi:Double-stranded RNA-specific editase 1 [Habropoda laboriosa]|uniref:Double-stranded RNA-specific editase 1 n=1 Tax=Habropoda laboriosa TaxID=597456 RepID=A0A0L7QNE5_9HYME|nr:Double-stranded RNA-specific editase 1 [Habropoda laboriosa]
MYTRSRVSQGYPNARNQNTPNVGYQGQSTHNRRGSLCSGDPPYVFQYNQQGGFQGSQPSQNQQSNYKQGGAQISPAFKPQQQQQLPMQQAASRNLPQGKPQQPQQQQSQQIKQSQQPIASSPQNQPQSQSQSQPQSQPQPIPQSLSQLQLQSQSQTQSLSQLQAQSQPQRLKPILKQPSHTQQQSGTTVQNNPVSSTQPSVPTPTPPVSSNSNPTPPITNNTSEVKNETQVPENADVEMQEQHPRWRRKAPGFRVNKRLKRLRLNQRLRKTLQPKNAIMKQLDGKTYVGQGLSKPLARQNAAENALKALLLEKMTAATMKARIDAESDGQANQSTEPSNIPKDDNSEEGGTPMDTSIDESDEIPWSSLASFALYKLFLEWHNQGTSVPVPRPGLPSPVKGAKREITHVQKTPVQKELPPNATNIHPVMLLNQMRPGLTYVELNRVGNPPNTMFTLAVDIDGIEYTGIAKNKKDAKKIAAKSALMALYGLNYPEEIKPVGQDQPMA